MVYLIRALDQPTLFLFCLDMWCHCSWKILNATLVISHLEVNPVWKDSRCLWSLKLYISCSPVELELFFLYWYICFLAVAHSKNFFDVDHFYQLHKRWSFHYQCALKRIFLEHKRVLWHRLWIDFVYLLCYIERISTPKHCKLTYTF